MEWAQAHARGMAAAAPYSTSRRAQRQLPGQTLSAIRKHSRETHPCGIKGCKRTAYKGRLCRGHWDLVPIADRVNLVIESVMAQRKVADRFHRRFLRDVQEKVLAE